MTVYEKLISLYSRYTEEYEEEKNKKQFIQDFLVQKNHSNINELLMFYAYGLNRATDSKRLKTLLAENPIEINNLINILNHFLFERKIDEKHKKQIDIIKEFIPEDSLFSFFQYAAVMLTPFPRLQNRFAKILNFEVSYSQYVAGLKKHFDEDNLMDRLIESKRRNVQVIEELIDAIVNFNSKPFYELKKETIALLDNEALQLVYGFITEYQEKQYKRLTKRLDTSEQLPEDLMEQILNSYQISLYHFSNKDKLLKYGNVENLKDILQSLKQTGLDFSLFEAETFLDIITFANPKDVYYIISLINKNAINLQFIYEHPGIFLNENSESKDLFQTKACFLDIVEKLNLIGSLNLDYKNHYSDTIFTLEKSELIKNIKLLRLYSNVFANQKLWCNLIINPSLFKLIDFFLENGIDFSEINFDNLAKEINVDNLIKRLYLALSCNLPIFKSGMIDLSILAHIEDQDLDEYIPSETEYFIPKDILEILQNNDLTTIDEYVSNLKELKQIFDSKDGCIYFGDDLIISKNKLLRNLSTILKAREKYSINDLIFYSLIYGSFLSNTDIDLIKNKIKKEK